jgi:hypothetical protein
MDPTVGPRVLGGDEPVSSVVARTVGIARISVAIRGAGLGGIGTVVTSAPVAAGEFAIDESPRFDDGLLDDAAVAITPSQVGS